MPTATTTITKTALSPQIPLKAGLQPSSSPVITSTTSSTTISTLKSLYNRAARAFLLRDVLLTQSLLDSAFSLIQPPSLNPDLLSDHRRKWDILRITLESTVYASPPSSHDTLPQSLRAILAESSQSLITASYTRSLALFTPASSNSQKNTLNAAFLPPQVLITLVYASLKLNCPDVGRVVIEDWLARRDPASSNSSASSQETEGDGYEKILELYCLNILPKLEQWEYAKEFLDYEGELTVHSREHMKSSLKLLFTQALASKRSPNGSNELASRRSSTSSPRSYSPAPSSSSSSSLSTTSTHTVTPSTPRASRSSQPISALTPLPQSASTSTSGSSSATTTPRAQPSALPNGRARSKARTTNSSSTSNSQSTRLSLPRSYPLAATVRPPSPSAYALMKASLAPYVTTSKVSTFVIIFLLLPLVSFLLRIRNRRRRLLEGAGAASNVDRVRRRLQGGSFEAGLVGRAWRELIRAIGDTVKMAGSGLV